MTHYSEKTVEFLWSLRLNNSREWFQAHKQEFETRMLAPTKDLANALFDHLNERWPAHRWQLHVSRIYRDARRLFGRGPMNDHLWFALWADKDKDEGIPGFYFSFEPEGWEYGMGLWTDSAAQMARFRAAIQRDPAPAEALAKRLAAQDVFVLGGEKYKKPKMIAPPLLQDWTDRKYLVFDCSHGHDETGFSDRLYQTVADGFDFLMPFYEYFNTLPNLEENK